MAEAHCRGAPKLLVFPALQKNVSGVQLGADVCVNYHDRLPKAIITYYSATDFVYVYYDNVGGETRSLCSPKSSTQIVACGAISGYNDAEKGEVTGWPEITNVLPFVALS